MKILIIIFLFFHSLFCPFWQQDAGSAAFSQFSNYKPGPNKMVINLEASTQKFEVPVKDVKTKVNNELTYYWYKSNQILHTNRIYPSEKEIIFSLFVI